MNPPPRDAVNKREVVRNYQVWQGNERFFCWGRCVSGPNWKSLIGTTVLILAPVVVYLAFLGPVLQRELTLAFPIIGGGLGLLALCFLYRTGCMDPGILPRQEPDSEYRAGFKPKTKEEWVNNRKVLVRYNETTHFYQPVRAHHCSVNDNCIEKFDHHCPWVGTTIGRRNYRYFLFFIFTASLLCIYVCATGVLTVKLEYDELRREAKEEGKGGPSLVDAIDKAPAAVALTGYAALFFLFVGGLSFFHIYLVSTNQTTYENFRYGYDRERNPYDEGCYKNCWSVLCAPIPESKCDFRGAVNQGTVPVAPQATSPDPSRSLSGRQPVQEPVTHDVEMPPMQSRETMRRTSERRTSEDDRPPQTWGELRQQMSLRRQYGEPSPTPTPSQVVTPHTRVTGSNSRRSGMTLPSNAIEMQPPVHDSAGTVSPSDVTIRVIEQEPQRPRNDSGNFSRDDDAASP